MVETSNDRGIAIATHQLQEFFPMDNSLQMSRKTGQAGTQCQVVLGTTESCRKHLLQAHGYSFTAALPQAVNLVMKKRMDVA